MRGALLGGDRVASGAEQDAIVLFLLVIGKAPENSGKFRKSECQGSLGNRQYASPGGWGPHPLLTCQLSPTLNASRPLPTQYYQIKNRTCLLTIARREKEKKKKLVNKYIRNSGFRLSV